MGRVAWSEEEDLLLKKYIEQYGEGKWHRVPLLTGLNRCRKSCRLRWLNYLRPNVKRGSFADDEADIIIKLHDILGNRWSLIAARLPGRTANDVKNYWNCHLSKKLNIKNNEKSKQPTKKPQFSKTRPKININITATSSTMSQDQETNSFSAPTLHYLTLDGDKCNEIPKNRESDRKNYNNDDDLNASDIGVHDTEIMDEFMELRYDYQNFKDVGEGCSKWESDEWIFNMDLWK